MKTLRSVIENRFSCRKFKPQVVPKSTLSSIFELAQKTPSWCNSQAWQVAMLSGATLLDFKADLHKLAQDETRANPDFKFPERYDGIYKDRRKVCGLQLYRSLGIDKGQTEEARQQMLENFYCFGAPHLAIISSAKSLGVYGAIDCGLFVNTLLLVAGNFGVDSIAQASIASYPDFIRSRLDLGKDRNIICGVALGYQDSENPINNYRTTRADITDVVNWIG